MIKFKDCIEGKFQGTLDFPSVSLHCFNGPVLHLKFTNKDLLAQIYYQGDIDPWMGALCAVALERTLCDLELITWRDLDLYFQDDQLYWDFKLELGDLVYFAPFELLKAALDKYRGRDYLYRTPDALICRCFGVREGDIVNYLKGTSDPSVESLALATKATLGCRSCLPQISRWFSLHESKNRIHFYKDLSRADWILEIDKKLNTFPMAREWRMQVESFKGGQVVISTELDVPQAQWEKVSVEIQDFLAPLDSDLSFFLTRSRQRSKA
jgi:hypothetical protein